LFGSGVLPILRREKTAMRRKDLLPKLEPDPVIEAYKKDVDRTLIRENLKLTVEQRIQKLMALQEFAEEMRGAARRAKKP
jgi:hypothetical protein